MWGENSHHDSPDRQTFVTEGWFEAGDFLQRQKHVKHPEMEHDYWPVLYREGDILSTPNIPVLGLCTHAAANQL